MATNIQRSTGRPKDPKKIAMGRKMHLKNLLRNNRLVEAEAWAAKYSLELPDPQGRGGSTGEPVGNGNSLTPADLNNSATYILPNIGIASHGLTVSVEGFPATTGAVSESLSGSTQKKTFSWPTDLTPGRTLTLPDGTRVVVHSIYDGDKERADGRIIVCELPIVDWNWPSDVQRGDLVGLPDGTTVEVSGYRPSGHPVVKAPLAAVPAPEKPAVVEEIIPSYGMGTDFRPQRDPVPKGVRWARIIRRATNPLLKEIQFEDNLATDKLWVSQRENARGMVNVGRVLPVCYNPRSEQGGWCPWYKR